MTLRIVCEEKLEVYSYSTVHAVQRMGSARVIYPGLMIHDCIDSSG